MEAFRTSADLYDALANRAGRLEREGPLLRHCLETAPGKKAADIACGTGLHAHFLAECGAQVEALDVSEEMVGHARRRRGHPNIAYRTGDMRSLQGGPWDLVVCVGNSLSLLASQADLAATFRAVRKGLSPGGLFLAHLLNYTGNTARKPRHRVEVATWDETRVVVVKSLVPDGEHTLLSLNFFVEERGERRCVSETAVQQNWTLAHVANAATETGLVVKALWGSFDRQRYQPEASSDLLILLAVNSP